MMACFNSSTLLKTPRRMRFLVISAKNRSTMLSHEPEVQVKARMPLEPALYRRGLVGGIIVDDEMQVEIGQSPFVDGLEKAEELAMPVAGHALADDCAVEHVESRKQGRGAVALVVMRHRPAAALLHRQPRLGAVERLDLAFFIDRQHQGLVGRIEVKADDILDLGDEVRIA